VVTSASNDRLGIECPVIRNPELELARPEEIEPLLTRLADRRSFDHVEVLPRGSLRPDGSLDLCKQGLGPNGLDAVVHGARLHPSVKHLLLGTNALGSPGIAALSEAVSEEHHIETLYLGCNLIDGPAIKPLATALRHDTTVEALWLKRNPLGADGISHIADLLAANTSLRIVDLVNTGIDRRGLEELASGLSSNSSNRIERLYLGGNHLDPDAAEAIGSIVDAAPHLAFLSVAVNRLGDEGFASLTRVAENHPQLRDLGAASNGLTSASADSLRRGAGPLSSLDLGVAPSTAVLGGDVNRVGDAGIIAIAESIREANGDSLLQALDLRQNGVTSRGAGILADVMASSPHSLQSVQLGAGIATTIKQRVTRQLHTDASADEPDLSVIASRYR